MKKSICPAPCGTRADRVSLHSGRGFITYFDFLFVFYLYKFYYDVAVFSLQAGLHRQDPQVFFHGNGRLV